MEKSKNVSDSVRSQIDYTVFKDGTLTKDQIKGWLQTDIRGVYMLLAEMLASVEVMDALVEVFWKRYVTLHEAKKAQQEMDLKVKQNESEI